MMENGDVPPTVPMLVPLSKNCTDTMLAPKEGVAVAVMVAPVGELTSEIVDPEPGVVIDIDGVANTVVAEIANRARKGFRRDVANRDLEFVDHAFSPNNIVVARRVSGGTIERNESP